MANAKKNCTDDQSIPKFSIAAGVHFGDPNRVHLPELSLIKQCVIYRGIAFVVIVILLGFQITERQPAKKGHIIVFTQPDAPRLLADRIRQQASSGNVFIILDGLHEFIGVTFVGSKPQADAFIPSRVPPNLVSDNATKHLVV